MKLLIFLLHIHSYAGIVFSMKKSMFFSFLLILIRLTLKSPGDLYSLAAETEADDKYLMAGFLQDIRSP